MTTVKAAPAAIDPWAALERVRAAAPLVQNITNYVVMNSTANALLAVGASPAMVHAVEEVEEFVAISRALVVNIGTLSPRWVEAMQIAAAGAAGRGIPWVLDPVGAGATRYRTETAARLVAMRPTVIRGNASEIMVVAGSVGISGKGVDSAHATKDALAPARALAARTGSLVAMTGVVDYVTDGTRAVSIANGHPMMARVTGLGCTATALVGAFLGANDDRLTAAVSALAVLGIAGEVASEHSPGPGSLQVNLLDALYRMDRRTLAERARITEAA